MTKFASSNSAAAANLPLREEKQKEGEDDDQDHAPIINIAKAVTPQPTHTSESPSKSFLTAPAPSFTSGTASPSRSAGPHTRVPPLAVIQTQKHMKDSFEYTPLCLQQEIRASTYSICAAQFSPDGSFFATAGEDRVVRVWEVNDFSVQCMMFLFEINITTFSIIAAELFFNTKPFREYSKHTKNVIGLSWCTRNTCFLLSAGLDNKIILWNLNKPSVPLQIFEISEPITAVCFMPDVEF